MKNKAKTKSIHRALLFLGVAFSVAQAGNTCEGYGPQAPRDIDQKVGENKSIFASDAKYQDMNLCNIHFHTGAEHKAKDFSLAMPKDAKGHGGGYQCADIKSLSKAELLAPKVNHCEGIQPGSTIEVHWVHSSCDVSPGKGLGSCLSESCANPELRVETQVFLVVNDTSALSFSDFAYNGNTKNGYHQAKSLPSGTGEPVEYLGSTTGPKYNEEKCSPYQVQWSVRPSCAKVDINTLSQWCEGNVFKENHAHGVREIVVNPKLLSNIKN